MLTSAIFEIWQFWKLLEAFQENIRGLVAVYEIFWARVILLEDTSRRLLLKILADDELIMMTNCFCGMVHRRKTFSLIYSRDHCQRSSPSRVSNTPQAEFEHAQNLSSGFIEKSCSAFDVIKVTTIEISFTCYSFTL